MKLTRRLARLEAEVKRLEEKRQALLAEHLALRASFIALAPFISASAAAQHAVAKSQAVDQVTTWLARAEFSEEQTAAVIEGIEAVFSELDAAHAAVDQPPPALS